MNEKLDQALAHLNEILPLKERQENCSPEIKSVHQQVLRSFVTNGRILTRDEIAQYVDNLDEAVEVLRSNDMVTFSEDGTPIGAYPFTMEEREHKIQVNGYQVHAMCALDALAVSPMFKMDAEINSECRVTGDPVKIQQSGLSIINLDEVGGVNFGIVWAAVESESCCADSLCMEMIFLRDDEIARQWLAVDADNREIFSLQDSVIFAERFFVPLLS